MKKFIAALLAVLVAATSAAAYPPPPPPRRYGPPPPPPPPHHHRHPHDYCDDAAIFGGLAVGLMIGALASSQQDQAAAREAEQQRVFEREAAEVREAARKLAEAQSANVTEIISKLGPDHALEDLDNYWQAHGQPTLQDVNRPPRTLKIAGFSQNMRLLYDIDREREPGDGAARDFFLEEQPAEHRDDRGRSDHHPVRVSRARRLHRHSLYPLVKAYPLKTEQREHERLVRRRQAQLAPERASRGEHRQRHREAQTENQRRLRLRERVLRGGEAAAPYSDGAEHHRVVQRARRARFIHIVKSFRHCGTPPGGGIRRQNYTASAPRRHDGAPFLRSGRNGAKWNIVSFFTNRGHIF